MSTTHSRQLRGLVIWATVASYRHRPQSRLHVYATAAADVTGKFSFFSLRPSGVFNSRTRAELLLISYTWPRPRPLPPQPPVSSLVLFTGVAACVRRTNLAISFFRARVPRRFSLNIDCARGTGRRVASSPRLAAGIRPKQERGGLH